MAKKEAKQNNQAQLPHYYRVIPARIRHHGQKIVIGFEILLLLCVGILTIFTYSSYKDAQIQRSEELAKLKLWEKSLSKHSTYPQAYYNAALHAARLGDSQKALEYLNQALSLNENYEPAKELKRLIAE